MIFALIVESERFSSVQVVFDRWPSL